MITDHNRQQLVLDLDAGNVELLLWVPAPLPIVMETSSDAELAIGSILQGSTWLRPEQMFRTSPLSAT